MSGWLMAVWLISACVSGATPKQTAVQGLTISAASSLTLAFEELGERYSEQYGVVVTLNFGASSQLAQQIEQGAPVDLFASASTADMARLVSTDYIAAADTRVYAVGRLTLWARADSSFTLGAIDDLRRDIVRTIALANPQTAPYGYAASQALERSGLQQSLQPKLVYAENVRQAMQFAETGDADVAFVSLSLSLPSNGRWILLPDSLHDPLEQTIGIVFASPHPELAQQFIDFLTGPTGQEVLKKYGYASSSLR